LTGKFDKIKKKNFVDMENFFLAGLFLMFFRPVAHYKKKKTNGFILRHPVKQ
jgi:hypothetical protein